MHNNSKKLSSVELEDNRPLKTDDSGLSETRKSSNISLKEMTT